MRSKYPLVPLALALALAAPALAQTDQTGPSGSPPTAPAPAPAAATTTATPTASTAAAPASSSAPEEVIQLSPFNVAADQVHGYTASETETGTRIASKIIDLPFSVDVVTNSFMNDFAAYNLNQQLAFVAGVSPSEIIGQIQLRGFQIPTVMVDGFRRVGLTDTDDIERIEIIKGPDASIYGAIQPGGAVNYVTYQPTQTPEQSLQIMAGGDSFYRATLSSSGPVGNSKTLFYRVDMADMFQNFSQQFSSRHQTSIAAKLLWQPDENTSIELALEHDELYEHPFEQALTITEKTLMPWAGDQITESQYFGMALGPQGLYDYNYAGPQSYDHNRVSSVTLTGEHKVSDLWSIRFSANDFKNPYDDQLVGSGAYYPYGTGNITLNSTGQITNAFTPEVKDQPEADWKPQWGEGYQLDNVFTFDTGPISHKLLLTTDFYGVSNRILTLVPTVNGSQATDYYAMYSAYNPSGAPYYTPASSWAPDLGYGWNTTLYSQDPSLYNGVTQDQWTFAGDYGFFASEHASMLDDRLNLILGGRYDWVHNEVANYNIAGPTSAAAGSITAEPWSLPGGTYQAFVYNTDAWTYQMGISYKVLPELSAFANRSSAFNPQPQIDTYTGEPLPNNKSTGYDWGLKGSFLGGKLTWTADRFAIYEYNLVQNETDPVTGQKDSILSGLQLAKGEELDLNYQATNDLQIFGDWGYTQTQVQDSDTLTFYNGLPARRVPRDNVGLGFRYQFSHGALRGLYVLGGMNYYSKSLVNLGSGKSLDPGPAATKANSTLSMYYVASSNLTYIGGTDPKISGEIKSSNGATPFYNLPFPGTGILPYPNVPAGTYMDYPVNTNGSPLPVATGVSAPSGDTVYVGAPTGVFVDDGRENNYNAPYALFQVGTGYQWQWGIFKNQIQINVQNLFNREYTYGSGAPGIPFTVIGSYTIQF